MKTLPIIEQHFHGAYGVDFNRSGVKEIIGLSHKLRNDGIVGFFPTLVTDSVENTKKQINVIKEASKECKGILGIHLEGIFLNPLKKGIHNVEHFMALTIENYKKLEDILKKKAFSEWILPVSNEKQYQKMIDFYKKYGKEVKIPEIQEVLYEI